jgi:hypothetical protein
MNDVAQDNELKVQIANGTHVVMGNLANFFFARDNAMFGAIDMIGTMESALKDILYQAEAAQDPKEALEVILAIVKDTMFVVQEKINASKVN